ncbi:MAG TPA: hypothetical protein VK420_02785 [Longimicrobium sp.]|nr:hypothetical protein [Longimicrobium sp.]
MPTRFDRLCYGLALLAGLGPLWVTEQLPLVDLPQHLHLISVLHRLDDTTTLYPRVFTLRGQLTPYLGYYYTVSLLNWLLPLGVANKVFLSAYVAAMPLSMAFLLRSLRRPTWPSLLALPFAYGDSFAWGFLNYCTALPLTFLCCGFFVRALQDPPRRRHWSAALSVCLVAVLLFHVQAFAFLGVGLPLLLLTTSTPEDRAAPPPPWSLRLRARAGALLGVLPGVLLFFVWVVGRVGEPTEIEVGAPWKAWGPMLSPQNVDFLPFEHNRDRLFTVLANALRDGSDRLALYGVGAVAAVAVLAWLLPPLRARFAEGWVERLRLPLLGLVALGMYFALPFDIKGYVYYLNTRYAHLAAPLLLASVPPLRARWRPLFVLAAAGCALLLGVTLGRGFLRFGEEARALARVAELAAPQARVMGLVYNAESAVVTHPVYLHSAAEVARVAGGYANFSFALTPHSPLKYRGTPPPTFPSEWNPHAFRWEQHAHAYDHFLLRGASAEQVLGARLRTELAVVGRTGGFTLVRRRTPP